MALHATSFELKFEINAILREKFGSITFFQKYRHITSSPVLNLKL